MSKRIILFSLLSCLSQSAFAAVTAPAAGSAAKCPLYYHLKDFTFYSLGDASVRLSDFQGLTGSSQEFYALSNFTVNGSPSNLDCLALSSGSNILISTSAVIGSVESTGQIKEVRSSVQGSLKAQLVSMVDAYVQKYIYSSSTPKYNGQSYTRQWKQSTAALTVDHTQIFSEAIALKNKLNAMPKAEVDCQTISSHKFDQSPSVVIDSEELSSCKTIILKASSKTKVTIHVDGSSVELIGLNVKLQGGLTPGQVVWNFSNLTDLFISNTASAYPGMPGHVFAPAATVEFYNGLITGSLVTGSLVYKEFDSRVGKVNPNEPNHTGQINSPVDGGHLPYD